MQTHSITMKARIFSDEEEETIKQALAEFANKWATDKEGTRARALVEAMMEVS
jgi:hypothetical protein